MLGSMHMSQSDIYCDQIIPGKLVVRILVETPNVLAFEHSNPYWKTHIVVIPKKHLESLAHIQESDLPILNETIRVASDVCKKLETELGGCRLSTNVGSYQSSKHLHFYIHAGPRLRNEDGSLVDSTH
jgi:histidine triad (HIT) family protein